MPFITSINLTNWQAYLHISCSGNMKWAKVPPELWVKIIKELRRPLPPPTGDNERSAIRQPHVAKVMRVCKVSATPGDQEGSAELDLSYEGLLMPCSYSTISPHRSCITPSSLITFRLSCTESIALLGLMASNPRRSF